ncbi:MULTISPECIES: M50 family metallopeptidase [Fervidobacterium]|uniref:Putative membrane-associated zinc metalloprotease n=1 Tax=Fervidobacterium nodosum (strain ATCC 35602 / DSM 5306 / Rt17-B1) TaxID=381764 RepID=A7HLL8_FERNB|nr:MULTISPECIES: site-2 protease family protein [Fervidobacterium]ABS60801.1 putative membrane-associated zinc metalloprotease [Fervidobacterium nodosum Rt17-B1]KAF2962005.1 peptidase [Fervidobacterium sp. 2310opik-2]
MTVLINIISFLAVFMFIVVVHEFGHFLFARLFGVKVHEFAIGFGPEIFRKKGKKTDFRINIFPLGGYVRLKGEDPSEEEDPDSLYGISAWKRFLVVFAGPLFSILAGYLLFVIIISAWGYTPIIIDKVIPNSAAEEAGLKDGDIVLKLNGKYIFDTVDMTDSIRKGRAIELEILRDGQRMNLVVTPKLSNAQYYLYLKDVRGDIGGKIETVNNLEFETYVKNYKKELVTIKSEAGELNCVIDSLNSLPERYTIGIYYGQFSNVFAKDVEPFKVGDNLLQVEDMKIQSGTDLLDLVTALNLKPDELYVVANGNVVESVVKPLPERVKVVYSTSNGEIKEIVLDKSKLLEALSTPGALKERSTRLKPRGIEGIKLAIARSNRLALYIWKTLPGIFVGKNIQDVTGPVGMVQIIGQAAQIGLETILTIVAVITINLGIFNLFPLPALDGGRIVFALIEMITRKKINRNVENIIHTIGFFILLGLVIFITFIDIGRFFR